MSKVLDILSLGAGVQSTAVLLMSIKGDLPPLDHAIFSDTGWEPKRVYQHLEWLKVECANAGLPLHVVSSGRSIREDAIVAQVRGKKEKGERWASMPLYVVTEGNSRPGMIRRQCTAEYKIAPIEKKARELAGIKPRSRVKELRVRHWFGISYDEMQRMRQSLKKWQSFEYPLIFELGIGNGKWVRRSKPLTRQDCLSWLKSNYPQLNPPRSACIGCPFKSNDEWRLMRDQFPEEWADAIEVDEKIRKCEGMRGDAFLHRSGVPLKEADIDTKSRGDDMFSGWNEECLGYCGA